MLLGSWNVFIYLLPNSNVDMLPYFLVIVKIRPAFFSQDLTETFPVKVEPFDEFASLKPEMMHLAQRNDGMLPHFSHKKYYGYVDLSLKSYFFHLMLVCRTHHVQ
jgi:hypothetical protein